MTDAPAFQRDRVLVIVAHPDDAEFGAAGTVAKFVDEGAVVGYVLMTNGDKGSGERDVDPAALAEIRQREQSAAAAALGASVFRFLGHPDGGVEDAEPAREQIVRAIREFRPDTVITFEPYRRSHTHRDHRNTGQMVLDAVYPFARDHLSYPEHLAEGIEPHKVFEVLLFASDFPDHWVDIRDSLHKKVAALKEHKSQIRDPVAMEANVRRRANESGKDQGIEFAEAFRRLEMGR